MLRITIPSVELHNEETNEFSMSKEYSLQLEHSLVSISKWESKWHIPFLGKGKKTNEQTIDYIRCMTLTQNVEAEAYSYLTQSVLDTISEYIDNPMTATKFASDKGKVNNEVITSETIYYWMVAFSIPWECQKWHLNRLLALVNLCSIKNQPKKKMSANEIRQRNKALNNARRKELGTKG